MRYPIRVELLPDGVLADFGKVPKEHRKQAEELFEKLYADLAGTGLSSDFVDGEPDSLIFEHICATVYGIPVPITAEQAEAIRHAKFEHGKEVDVLAIDGGHFILSNSGSRRILANVRARYIIAKRLCCKPRVINGGVQWSGQIELDCGN
jgi:uncharacterized protein (DUF779 family)